MSIFRHLIFKFFITILTITNIFFHFFYLYFIVVLTETTFTFLFTSKYIIPKSVGCHHEFRYKFGRGTGCCPQAFGSQIRRAEMLLYYSPISNIHGSAGGSRTPRSPGYGPGEKPLLNRAWSRRRVTIPLPEVYKTPALPT